MFRMSKTEGPSSSISRAEGGGGGPRAGGEGGAGFDRLASGVAGGDKGVSKDSLVLPWERPKGSEKKCLGQSFHLEGVTEDMGVRGQEEMVDQVKLSAAAVSSPMSHFSTFVAGGVYIWGLAVLKV